MNRQKRRKEYTKTKKDGTTRKVSLCYNVTSKNTFPSTGFENRVFFTLFQSFTQQLTEKVRSKIQTLFLPLLYGILLAIARRRTVTTWLCAAQISNKSKADDLSLLNPPNYYPNLSTD